MHNVRAILGVLELAAQEIVKIKEATSRVLEVENAADPGLVAALCRRSKGVLVARQLGTLVDTRGHCLALTAGAIAAECLFAVFLALAPAGVVELLAVDEAEFAEA